MAIRTGSWAPQNLLAATNLVLAISSIGDKMGRASIALASADPFRRRPAR
ncbi:MAG TPA: hypothetical protein VL128_16165 [Candidatus Eisenbacteria bacterium]|nr:hypothetical protein [Candidatus Eisenbacteria bacterium]